jgi:hypothetical protein
VQETLGFDGLLGMSRSLRGSQRLGNISYSFFFPAAYTCQLQRLGLGNSLPSNFLRHTQFGAVASDVFLVLLRSAR